jgi:hypothetical protein
MLDFKVRTLIKTAPLLASFYYLGGETGETLEWDLHFFTSCSKGDRLKSNRPTSDVPKKMDRCFFVFLGAFSNRGKGL